MGRPATSSAEVFAMIVGARRVGDPDGREFNESVEDEVDALTCPHCGGKVPRG